MSLRLGELLIKENLISKEQLEQALEFQKKNGLRLGSALIKLGLVSEDDIAMILSKQFGYPSINISKFEVDPEVLKLIPAELARKYTILPLHRMGFLLTVAMADPTNMNAIDDIRFKTELNVQPVVAPETPLKMAIEKYYGSTTDIEVAKAIERFSQSSEDASYMEVVVEKETDIVEIERQAEQAPVIQFVNLLLYNAIEKKASDIHIEPYEKELRMRLRIDGILYPFKSPPFAMKDAIVSRIKILSKMDIAEKRLPQNGRIKFKVKSRDGTSKEVDMRVSTLPTVHGEKVVIRILDRSQLKLDLTQLGFEHLSLQRFEDAISKPWGIILVTGPTGSGKTNTLYSAINKLNTPDTNILTVEDPVEFNIHGINQVNIHDEIGLTFAEALRAFLRQDPNIILVGEIRDFETADIAMKAALTGHLVLSTIHTNDSASTVSRLINMGIEPFLVANSVLLIVAQRLVRRLCNKCKVINPLSPQALIEFGFLPDEIKNLKVYKPKGCSECNGIGYKGRIGLFEVMSITDEIRELIVSGAHTIEIRNKAIEQGMVTLRRSGLEKIKSGITSIEEVLRETMKF
ncbi:MAG: type IV-A pilus assembly ATPase PilB [Candidatus Aminicenantia bacterium]